MSLAVRNLIIRIDCIYWTLRHTQIAINAILRVDHEKIWSFMEAFGGAHLHAGRMFAVNAVFGNDVGHGDFLYSARRQGTRMLNIGKMVKTNITYRFCVYRLNEIERY